MSTVLANLSTLTDAVQARLAAACPRVLVLDALRWSARRLCRETGAWREDVDVTTVAGTLEYAVTLPAGTTAEALVAVLTAEGAVWAAPERCEWVPPATLVLTDDPGAQTLTVTLLCMPSGDSIPAWLATQYADALVYGALTYRQVDPARPWTDANSAALNADRFRDECDRLRQRLHGKHVGRSRTALQGVVVR